MDLDNILSDIKSYIIILLIVVYCQLLTGFCGDSCPLSYSIVHFVVLCVPYTVLVITVMLFGRISNILRVEV